MEGKGIGRNLNRTGGKAFLEGGNAIVDMRSSVCQYQAIRKGGRGSCGGGSKELPRLYRRYKRNGEATCVKLFQCKAEA